MRVIDFEKFVASNDLFAEIAGHERMDVAMYGIAGEIGSVVTAVKKKIVGQDVINGRRIASDEITEELGDVLWYTICLGRLFNGDNYVNLCFSDINELRSEIGAKDERAKRIAAALDPASRENFLLESENFHQIGDQLTFDDYQRIAFLTARTSNRTLLEVCVAVLSQLSAELLRKKLPESERDINRQVADRPVNNILGEIIWHVSAIASLFDLSLNSIAEANRKKIAFRIDRTDPTPLHDVDREIFEQFPRVLKVVFVPVGSGRLQMYLNGQRLGDVLTDNAYQDDGYRYHDIMHLALVANLGWSPVLRKLLGRKRKTDPKLDEIEDGARAGIVEEAIIKMIHTEGERIARERGDDLSVPTLLIKSKREITFSFLKRIHHLVRGFEVSRNKLWEWENAITNGLKILYALKMHEKGTVTVDLPTRTIQFCEHVFLDVSGNIGGIGVIASTEEINELELVKLAILESMGHDPHGGGMDLDVLARRGQLVSYKAKGELLRKMWDRRVVSFRCAIDRNGNRVSCTVLAIVDARPNF